MASPKLAKQGIATHRCNKNPCGECRKEMLQLHQRLDTIADILVRVSNRVLKNWENGDTDKTVRTEITNDELFQIILKAVTK